MTTDATPSGYTIRADRDAMDLDRVHEWLSTDAYWALGWWTRSSPSWATGDAHGVYARAGFEPPAAAGLDDPDPADDLAVVQPTRSRGVQRARRKPGWKPLSSHT